VTPRRSPMSASVSSGSPSRPKRSTRTVRGRTGSRSRSRCTCEQPLARVRASSGPGSRGSASTSSRLRVPSRPTGSSRETSLRALIRTMSTSRSRRPVARAISSQLGDRPNRAVRSRSARRTRRRRSTAPRGSRTSSDWREIASTMRLRIHHTAYERKRTPRAGSKRLAASRRPRAPSASRSSRGTPRCRYSQASGSTRSRCSSIRPIWLADARAVSAMEPPRFSAYLFGIPTSPPVPPFLRIDRPRWPSGRDRLSSFREP
jgi:hypothetical protein